MVILPTKEMFPTEYRIRCDCGNLIKTTKGRVKIICYTCEKSVPLEKVPFLMNEEYDIYSYLELHTRRTFDPNDRRVGHRVESVPGGE